ncbi:unnamed protein product [Vitrella brassicaformis CCMP3155]|uniref:Tetratricopeptide SHNi-TPR domain-containing protein n=3 Tax=Vitrella brassicaformis TaxID=1169539 RepID=A0A0G4FHZ0_VITBC|nr:unnamed protein product [Vitrella brassicaformis CCMP3155]|eukprot:CEM13093.1 unnamed protein product [Vitrella brassicaformis CCMP3155]
MSEPSAGEKDAGTAAQQAQEAAEDAKMEIAKEGEGGQEEGEEEEDEEDEQAAEIAMYDDMVKEKGPDVVAKLLTEKAMELRADNIQKATAFLSKALAIKTEEHKDANGLHPDLASYYLNYGDFLLENSEADLMRNTMQPLIDVMCGGGGDGDDQEDDEDEDMKDNNEREKEDKKPETATATNGNGGAEQNKTKDPEVTGGETKEKEKGAGEEVVKAGDEEGAKGGEGSGENGDDGDEEMQGDTEEDMALAWDTLELGWKCYRDKIDKQQKEGEQVDMGDVKAILFAKTRLGDLLTIQKRFEQAVQEYDAGMKTALEHKLSYHELINNCMEAAHAYEHLKDNANVIKAFELAKEHIEKALSNVDGVTLDAEEQAARKENLEEIDTKLERYRALIQAGAKAEESLGEEEGSGDVMTAEVRAKVITEASKLGNALARMDASFGAPQLDHTKETVIVAQAKEIGEGPLQVKKRRIEIGTSGASSVAEPAQTSPPAEAQGKAA